MKTPKHRHSLYITTLLAVAGIAVTFSNNVQAANVTWQSATTGGDWATGAAWSSGTTPGSSDTVYLNNATANRIITIASSATSGAITMVETSSFTNELDVTKSLYMGSTNLTVTGTTSGTSVVRLGDKTSNSTVTLTVNRVTLNTGGWLILQVGGSTNGGTVNVGGVGSGHMTISGGVLSILAGGAGGGSPSVATIGGVSGDVAMSSGTILLSDTVGGLRLGMTSLNATGGSIVSNNSSNYLMLTGSNVTNTIGSSVTTSGVPNIYMTGNNSTLNYNSTGAATVLVRNLITGTTGVTLQTSSTSSTIASFNTVQFGNTGGVGASSLAKITLGSDVKTTSASSPVLGVAFTSGSTDNFELDLGGHTFDATASTAGWVAQTSATTNWTISSTGSAGTMKMLSVNLSTPNVQTTIGNRVTLSITGGGSTNVLSGSGTIAPTSTFLYTGASGTATLTSNRTIGRLEVGTGTSASYLNITGADLAVGADVNVKSSSVLDLGGKNLTESAVAGGTSGGLNGAGTIRNNTSGTTSTLTLNTNIGNGNFSGNIVDNTTGTGKVAVTVTGTGSQILSGANTYTGATSITGGTLSVNGSLGATAVTVGSGATLAGTGTANGTVTASGNITGSLTFNNDVTVNQGATAAAAAFKGNIVDNGTITSAVNVQSAKTLSGTGSVTNSVTVLSGGKTSAGNGSDTGVLTLDLAYNSGAVANFNVSSTSNGSGLTAINSGLSYSQVVVSGSAGAVNLQIGEGTAATQTQANGSSNSGVTLEVTLSLADYTTLVANSTNNYIGGHANNTLDNFFVFNLGSGLVAGEFQTLALDIGGTEYTGTIYYSGTNDRFNGIANLGNVTVNGQEFAISYVGNASTNSTIGGNDVVLTAVPEPSTWAIMFGGLGMLLGAQSLRRRKLV